MSIMDDDVWVPENCEGCGEPFDGAPMLNQGGILLCAQCYVQNERALRAVYGSAPDEDGVVHTMPDEPLSEAIAHEGVFEDEPVEGAVQTAVQDAPFELYRGEHQNALMVRESAGVRVEACYLPLTEVFGVTVTVDGQSMWAGCTPDTFLDAFEHPALYLSAKQCELIGLR